MTQRAPVSHILLGIIVGIDTVHYLASWYDWYHTVWWIDIPLHIAGGAFIGVLFVYLFRERFKVLHATHWFPALILGTGFVALIGIGWEFYEFWVDVWLVKKYPMNEFPGAVHADTLLDLLNDMLGGAVAIAALQLVSRDKK
jgi:hypothetical protein